MNPELGASCQSKDRFKRTPLDLVESRLKLVTDLLLEREEEDPERMDADDDSLISSKMMLELRQLIDILIAYQHQCHSEDIMAEPLHTVSPREETRFESDYRLDVDALTEKLQSICTKEQVNELILDVQGILGQLKLKE
jgi:hypothetical protein